MTPIEALLTAGLSAAAALGAAAVAIASLLRRRRAAQPVRVPARNAARPRRR